LPVLFWDASALAKRYIPEVGSATADALFASVPTSPMLGTLLGYAETYSILLRSRNRGAISGSSFSTAKNALRNEVLRNPRFTLLSVDDGAILAGLALMDQYNLNATDGAILASLLSYLRTQSPSTPHCMLVAADQRLLIAAQSEGLRTLNPETVAPVDVPSLIASL
jgi:uncharacterized protein